jgi:hypothetical protein
MPAITDIRERTAFLEKSTRYVFSMELRLAFACPTRPGASDGRLRAERADPPALNHADTYHVIDDELITTVDGAVHESPLLLVEELLDWISIGPSGVLSLNGRGRLRSDDDARISMSYSGVVRLGLRGGKLLLQDGGAPQGVVQLAAQFESDRPRYRWLTQAQFIGFGTAACAQPGEPDRRAVVRKTLTLSLDFYSAM